MVFDKTAAKVVLLLESPKAGSTKVLIIYINKISCTKRLRMCILQRLQHPENGVIAKWLGSATIAG